VIKIQLNMSTCLAIGYAIRKHRVNCLCKVRKLLL